MKCAARRGVCIGVDRHLQAGDLADLDAAQVQFLVSIGAVEIVPDAPVVAEVPVPEPPPQQPEEEPAKEPEPTRKKK